MTIQHPHPPAKDPEVSLVYVSLHNSFYYYVHISTSPSRLPLISTKAQRTHPPHTTNIQRGQGGRRQPVGTRSSTVTIFSASRRRQGGGGVSSAADTKAKKKGGSTACAAALLDASNNMSSQQQQQQQQLHEGLLQRPGFGGGSELDEECAT